MLFRSTGRRKCIFLLLLIIFGLIIVLIFKPRRHSSSSLPAPSTSPSPSSHTTVTTDNFEEKASEGGEQLPPLPFISLLPPSQPISRVMRGIEVRDEDNDNLIILAR